MTKKWKPPTYEILRISEVAEWLRTPEATLRFWRTKGTGPPSFKMGRRVVYLRADVEAWLQKQVQ